MRRRPTGVLRALAAIIGAILVVSGAALPVSAAEACFSQAALEAAATCPEAPASAPPARRPAPPRPASGWGRWADPASLPGAVRDARPVRRAPRPLLDVVRQQQTLELALAFTALDAPDRPALLRSLAEGYVELASAASAAASTGVVVAARRRAIGHYEALRSQHATDEILYYLAYEHELLNELDEAKTLHTTILARWPRSRFAHDAARAVGALLMKQGKAREAIETYKGLLVRDPGPRACVYQGHVAEATRALGDREAVLEELHRLLDVSRRVQDDACANITAALLVETAMDWHVRAVGSGREPDRRKLMGLATRLYEQILASFTDDQLASFQFPAIPKEDRPSPLQLRYALADLLYFQKDWSRCGPAFDAVVASAPEKRVAEEAALAAALCYLYHFEDAAPKGADRKRRPRELSAGEEAMVTAWSRFLCTTPPRSNDPDFVELQVEMRHARGRIRRDAGRWEEAALDFRGAALSGAATKIGAGAAKLYVEALEAIASSAAPPRPSCYDRMADDAPTLVDLYCRSGKGKANAEPCGLLIRVAREFAQRGASSSVQPTDRTGADALRRYEQAGRALLEVWDKYGREPCQDGLPACRGAEEALYDAARAFQAARLPTMALSTRRILVDPKNGLSGTLLARRAVYEIGDDYKALGDFEEAALWYEKFAEASPEREKAADALHQAVLLRLGLLEVDRALQDAARFDERHGKTRPALAAEIALAITAHDMDE